MPSRSDERSIIDAERRFLRALCQESCPVPARESAKNALVDYLWREPVHEIIFSFVVVQPATAPIPLRDQLPGVLTRKGFPDVEWEAFFQPVPKSETKLADLIRELAASNEAGTKPGPT